MGSTLQLWPHCGLQLVAFLSSVLQVSYSSPSGQFSGLVDLALSILKCSLIITNNNGYI